MPYNGAIDLWSLACVCTEMFLGLPLFPGVSQHNQISRIVEMLGQPPDLLIDGRAGAKYFAKLSREERLASQLSDGGAEVSPPPSATSVLHAAQAQTTPSKYRLKTPEEYARETNTEVPVLKKYLRYNRLEEVIMKCPLANKAKLSHEQKMDEMQRRKCFLHFLQGLFVLNPFERWTAKQAASHPFITNAPFSSSFRPAIDPKINERKLQYLLVMQNKGSSIPPSVPVLAGGLANMGLASGATGSNFKNGVSGQRQHSQFVPLVQSGRRASEPLDLESLKHSLPSASTSGPAAAVSTSEAAEPTLKGGSQGAPTAKTAGTAAAAVKTSASTSTSISTSTSAAAGASSTAAATVGAAEAEREAASSKPTTATMSGDAAANNAASKRGRSASVPAPPGANISTSSLSSGRADTTTAASANDGPRSRSGSGSAPSQNQSGNRERTHIQQQQRPVLRRGQSVLPERTGGSGQNQVSQSLPLPVPGGLGTGYSPPTRGADQRPFRGHAAGGRGGQQQYYRGPVYLAPAPVPVPVGAWPSGAYLPHPQPHQHLAYLPVQHQVQVPPAFAYSPSYAALANQQYGPHPGSHQAVPAGASPASLSSMSPLSYSAHYSGSMQENMVLTDFGQALMRPEVDETRHLSSMHPHYSAQYPAGHGMPGAQPAYASGMYPHPSQPMMLQPVYGGAYEPQAVYYVEAVEGSYEGYEWYDDYSHGRQQHPGQGRGFVRSQGSSSYDSRGRDFGGSHQQRRRSSGQGQGQNQQGQRGAGGQGQQGARKRSSSGREDPALQAGRERSSSSSGAPSVAAQVFPAAEAAADEVEPPEPPSPVPTSPVSSRAAAARVDDTDPFFELQEE